MISIDQLCYRSHLRYENAGEKFAFSVITLCICVFSRSIAVSGIALFATGMLIVRKGGVPFSRYLYYMSVPLSFLLLSSAAILFHIQKSPMDLFAVPVGSWYFTTGKDSLFYGSQLILTALSSVSCLYFLAFTTPVPDILDVLKQLHCPRLLIELMLLIYRFIFVLMETASALTTASSCRLGNKDFKTSLKSFGMLGSSLMIRAVRRANRLYEAMEARSYDGTILVLSENHPPRKSVVFSILLFDGLLFLFALWRKYYL